MKILREKYDGLQELKKLPQYLKSFLSLPSIKKLLEDYNFTVLYRAAYNYLDTIKIHKVTELLNTLGIDPLDYLDYIPNDFLSHTQIKSVTIPNHIKGLGIFAFYDCSGLTSIEIPSSITNIEYAVFRNCSGLTSVEIPESVTFIGSYAFDSCTSLTSIKIPENVTFIGSYAFYNCPNLIVYTKNQYVINYCKENKIEYKEEI